MKRTMATAMPPRQLCTLSYGIRAAFVVVAAQILYTCTFLVFDDQRHYDVLSRKATYSDSNSILWLGGGGDSDRNGENRQRPGGRLPLRELVDTKPEMSCPSGLFLVNDTVAQYNSNGDILGSFSGHNHSSSSRISRKIPRIVHVTSRTRCMPKEFADNLDLWRFPDHSFYFHNEEAMERLLSRHWPEFPQLQQALKCTKGGAGRADVWRALVLWKYGGIYTDIDNAPGPKFNSSTTIQDDDEAFFVIERSAILSQYFFAARPRHPLFYLLVQHMMSRLLSLNDVGMQIVSVVTGPGALRMAFCNFLDLQGGNAPYGKPSSKCWKYIKAGTYSGMHGSTVRAVGHEDRSDDYVARDIIPDKNLIYQKMNMTYFRDIPKVESMESCFQRIYKEAGLYYYNSSDLNRFPGYGEVA